MPPNENRIIDGRGRLDVRLWLIGIVADIEMGWPVFDLADDELYDRIICSG
jgi:hypothetical protein